MKDMLYYPGFETQNENWLKFALLYFDVLRPIIPMTFYSEEKYLSDTFRMIMNETDLIQPYRPNYDEGVCASILACEEFDKYLQNPNRYGQYFSRSRAQDLICKWNNPSYQDSLLFEGKYSKYFFEYCIHNRIATPCSKGIYISSDLSFVYMSILADIISKNNEYEMITDTEKYSRFLINKDLTIAKNTDRKIHAIHNEIELLLPVGIESIPIECLIDLRKRNDFNTARYAYISEVEQLILHRENGQYHSMDKQLSYMKDFVDVCKDFFGLAATAVVNVYSFNELWNAPEQGILNAVACVLIDSKATSEAFYKIPQFINNIKKKHQARRYTAFLKKVNEPVRKTGLR